MKSTSRYVGSLAVTVALIAACGGDDTNPLQTQVALLQTQVAQPTATVAATPTPGPDRVVGVTWTCTTFFGKGPEQEDKGTFCEWFYSDQYKKQANVNYTPTAGGVRVFIYKIRALVNVRTSVGSVYTAYLDDPPNDIQLGDPWPPR